MDSASVDDLKSPLKKLVRFFRDSRDEWKQKYFAKRDQAIKLANQVRAVEKSRAHWKVCAKDAQREVRELRAELKKTLQTTSSLPRTQQPS